MVEEVVVGGGGGGRGGGGGKEEGRLGGQQQTICPEKYNFKNHLLAKKSKKSKSVCVEDLIRQKRQAPCNL